MYNHGNGEHKIQNWPKVLLLRQMRLDSKTRRRFGAVNKSCHVAIQLSVLGECFFFLIHIERIRILKIAPIIGLTPPHVWVCPKPGPGFPTSYVFVFFFFMFRDMRWETVVRFVKKYWWNSWPSLFNKLSFQNQQYYN